MIIRELQLQILRLIQNSFEAGKEDAEIINDVETLLNTLSPKDRKKVARGAFQCASWTLDRDDQNQLIFTRGKRWK